MPEVPRYWIIMFCHAKGGPILSLEISDTHGDNVPRTPLVEGDDAARLRAKGAFLRASQSTPTLTPLDIQASTPVGDGLSVRYVATGLVHHTTQGFSHRGNHHLDNAFNPVISEVLRLAS